MTTQEDRTRLMRRKLLDSAIDCVFEHGYAGATAVTICQHAGVTCGALHHHFKNGKTDLMEAVITELYDRMGSLYCDWAKLHPKQVIMEYLDGFFAPEEHKRQVVSVEIWLAATRDPSLKALRNAVEQKRHNLWHIAAQSFQPDSIMWMPQVLTLTRIIRTCLRGYAIERHLDTEDAHQPIEAWQTLRKLVERELNEIYQGIEAKSAEHS